MPRKNKRRKSKIVDLDASEDSSDASSKSEQKGSKSSLENVEEIITIMKDAEPKFDDPTKYQSLSDDEIIQNSIKPPPDQADGILSPSHAPTPVVRRGRRTKSLCTFELNEYTLGEIRRLHERLASRQPGAFRPRTSLFKNFTRTQKMALCSLCLVDFTSFCSMSIMAPFFPKEVSEFFLFF